MGLKLIPTDDPPRALYLRRQLMGLVSYVMFLLPLVYSVHHGWMRFGYLGLAIFSALCLALNFAFFIAIASGFSQRFRDPGLTMAQIATAMLLALLLIHFAGEARSIFLLLFFASLFFGVFGLNARQFFGLSATAVVGYAVLMVLESRFPYPDQTPLRRELLNFITLVMILSWMSLIGSYVAGLRVELARRKDELARAMSKLTDLVSHDELTGAYNRRHLMDILQREKDRADRYGHSYSLCIIDLDHFKRINDSYGHGVGDEVLKEFSERMRRCARSMDWLGRPQADNTFGRYGGEEFLLVLPHTPLVGAERCVERIREIVQNTAFVTAAGPLQVTFSAGLAEHYEREPVASTLSRADQALYRAKAAGRNRSESDRTLPADIPHS